jgi:hypothetical protein
MSIQEVSAEQLAELFHHYDQALRADRNRTSKPDPEAWEKMPHQERSRLVAVARLALLELASRIGKLETPGGISQSRVKPNGAAEIEVCSKWNHGARDSNE